MEDTTEIVEVTNVTSFKYQLAKMLFATTLAFAASKLGEKTFDWTLRSIQTRATDKSAG